jgi:glycosyltransferase involved in cell wall biosynthesis
MLSISIALLAFYAILISYFFVGWMLVVARRKKASAYDNKDATGFSVIISARNEEKNIEACLQSISKEKYQHAFFEIIVIDDGSTDKTADIINTFISQSRNIGTTLKIQYLKSDLKNKKAAITMGISHAKHEYIILTDADCTRNEHWLSAINQFIKQSECKMIYAPVRFKAHSIFEKMQALEFAGLVGIGAASMELKNPNMCSAANLIFEKKVFEEVKGYQDNMHLLSGDDEFLMHKIFKLYPDKVKFLLNYDAMVTTSASSLC